MRQFLILGLAAFALSGCLTTAIVKTAALPVKATYGATKLVGKGVVGTGKMIGKTVVPTGKGVYYVGSIPVKITDRALDVTTEVLVMTIQAVDQAGKVYNVTRQFQAAQLDAEIMALRGAENIISVLVDAYG